MTLALKDADLTGNLRIAGVPFATAVSALGGGNSVVRVIAATQAARYALTIADIQSGDLVLQSDTGLLYQVIDETALGTAAAFMALVLRLEPNGAVVAGDLAGNARGISSLEIQSFRSAVSQVASGDYSCCFGNRNTASGLNSVAIGRTNTASGLSGSAIGRSNTASSDCASAFGYSNFATGFKSSAFGYYNRAPGNKASAFGYYNTASGAHASAFGIYSKATGSASGAFGYLVQARLDKVQELGYWFGETVRSGAVRIHGTTGMVAMTVAGSATAFANAAGTIAISGPLVRAGNVATVTTTAAHGLTDGSRITTAGWTPSTFNGADQIITVTGAATFTYPSTGTDGSTTVAGTLVASVGSERDGTLAKGMVAFRKNGTALYVDWNDAGTIRTFTL